MCLFLQMAVFTWHCLKKSKHGAFFSLIQCCLVFLFPLFARHTRQQENSRSPLAAAPYYSPALKRGTASESVLVGHARRATNAVPWLAASGRKWPLKRPACDLLIGAADWLLIGAHAARSSALYLAPNGVFPLHCVSCSRLLWATQSSLSS